MSIIVIKDISDERELTSEEMESVEGGAFNEPFGFWEIIDKVAEPWSPVKPYLN